MKTHSCFLSFPALIAAMTIGSILLSCNKFPSDNGQGSLCWSFSPGIQTKAPVAIPDTDAFKLKVVNSANNVLYDGAYGDSPESMLVNPGTYTISVVSRIFSKPEFDAPQFGDEQVVVVKAGEVTKARLDCSQLNCGLRLVLDPDFGSKYPGGTLTVSSQNGSLTYPASEKRTGYFKPGSLAITLNDASGSTKLLTRNLEARDMLTLGVSCPAGAGSQGGELSIAVDTARTWTTEEYEIGSGENGDSGTSKGRAYGVSQVKDHPGEKAVWVCGYIVGGDLSSSKNGIRFEPPFDSMTNIALGARSTVSEKSSCVSVQLAKGEVRDALNLVTNPTLLGKKVYLKGDIEAAYYGIPGIKNITEYSID